TQAATAEAATAHAAQSTTAKAAHAATAEAATAEAATAEAAAQSAAAPTEAASAVAASAVATASAAGLDLVLSRQDLAAECVGHDGVRIEENGDLLPGLVRNLVRRRLFGRDLVRQLRLLLLRLAQADDVDWAFFAVGRAAEPGDRAQCRREVDVTHG